MGKKSDISGFSKKERKEYLRGFRQGEEKKEARKSLVVKLIVGAVVLAVVGGIGYLFATSNQDGGSSYLLGEEIPDLGANHINQGERVTTYNSNPPTSGPHWSTPQTCDFYTEEVPDEAVVHSLEHGAIWVTYKDKSLEGSMKSLFEKESAKVLISPRSANDSLVAVASWGRLLKLDEFDEDQIIDFIGSNRNNSPEPLAPC